MNDTLTDEVPDNMKIPHRSKRTRSLAALLAAGMAYTLLVSSASAATRQADSEIQIVPATKVIVPVAPPAPADPNGTVPKATQSYGDVYRSIPFSRAEYNANPSYRHEAAMEMLFGQLRPTTIVRYSQPDAATNYDYNYFDYITPYRYDRNGYGRSYNFFYPRPTVYRNY